MFIMTYRHNKENRMIPAGTTGGKDEDVPDKCRLSLSHNLNSALAIIV